MTGTGLGQQRLPDGLIAGLGDEVMGTTWRERLAFVLRSNSIIRTTFGPAVLEAAARPIQLLGVGASPATLFAVDAGTFVCSGVLVILIGRPFGRGRTEQYPGALAGLRLIAPSLGCACRCSPGWSRSLASGSRQRCGRRPRGR
jgi:hypothetical protein